MKTFIVVLLVGMLATISMNTFAADDTPITYKGFAEMLVSTLAIELPADTESLSDKEYFEVLANALTTAGITNFVEVDPSAPVTYGEFIDIMYAAFGGAEGATTEEKYAYINSICPLEFGDINRLRANVTFEDAVGFLNNPACAAAVVEAYSPIETVERAGTEAPGFKLEETPKPVAAGGAIVEESSATDIGQGIL